jgi:phosphatidate cytidylyltransferase
VFIAPSAVAGDLFQSALKRRMSVKDTGNIMPGHGGVLDRFDAMLFALPVFFLLLYFGAI